MARTRPLPGPAAALASARVAGCAQVCTSAMTTAHRITKPLFVIRGRNDARVRHTEAEQIVARLRADGTPVWSLRAENARQGFARMENADCRQMAVVRFLETVLASPR